MLDISWPMEQISAFLRSLDYGKIRMFPKPRLILLNKCCLIKGYKIARARRRGPVRLIVNNYRAFICKEDLSITLDLENEGCKE